MLPGKAQPAATLALMKARKLDSEAWLMAPRRSVIVEDHSCGVDPITPPRLHKPIHHHTLSPSRSPDHLGSTLTKPAFPG